MASKTVRLEIEPDMLELFMSCFTVDSVCKLQTEQNNGFQFISPIDRLVDVVLIKPDAVVRTPDDLVKDLAADE